MNVLASASLVLVAAAASSVDVPIAELNLHDIGFMCAEDGIPTLRIEHTGASGVIRYAQYGSVGGLSFDLDDAVKSVVHERSDGVRRWIIRAEGAATNVSGIAAKTPASLDLVISLTDEGVMTGDFSARAGDVSYTGKSCQRMPPGALPLRKAA